MNKTLPNLGNIYKSFSTKMLKSIFSQMEEGENKRRIKKEVWRRGKRSMGYMPLQ